MTVTCRGCDARVSDTTSGALAADLTTHDQECPAHGWRRCEHPGACYQEEKA
jgi:hypothetical protein